MATKTTVDSRGVVTETIAGTKDVLVVDVDNPRERINEVVNANGVNLIDGGATLFITRGATDVTASLPALSGTVEEGEKVLILLDGDGNNVLAVTGSAGALSIDGNILANVSGAYGHIELMAVKADNSGSFAWHIIDQKPPL